MYERKTNNDDYMPVIQLTRLFYTGCSVFAVLQQRFGISMINYLFAILQTCLTARKSLNGRAKSL